MGWLDAWFVSESVWHITYPELALRMAIATVLGGLIGIEREWNNHPAGFRTHILVCLGSATIMILSIYGFSSFIGEANVRADPARLAAQVVSGIGFLGAGAIVRNGSLITGLTTAASVWIVASIGLCVGAGFYGGAVSAAVLVLVSLHLFNRWEKRWLKHRRYHTADIRMIESPEALLNLIRFFGENGIAVKSIRAVSDPGQTKEAESRVAHIHFQLKTADLVKLFDVFTQAAALTSVLSIESPAYEFRKRGKSGTHEVPGTSAPV